MAVGPTTGGFVASGILGVWTLLLLLLLLLGFHDSPLPASTFGPSPEEVSNCQPCACDQGYSAAFVVALTLLSLATGACWALTGLVVGAALGLTPSLVTRLFTSGKVDEDSDEHDDSGSSSDLAIQLGPGIDQERAVDGWTLALRPVRRGRGTLA